MPVKYQRNDGGRNDSSITGEQKDCTVRTYARALNIPYDEAHSYFESKGRKKGKGIFFDNVVKDDDRFMKITIPTSIYKNKPTVNQCIAYFNKGTYVFKVNHHVFVVKDGVLLDHIPPKPKQVVYYVMWVIV